MIKVLASALIAEFLFFLIHDCLHGRGGGSERFLVRCVAGVSGLVMVLSDLLIPGGCSLDGLIYDCVAALVVLTMCPCSFEKPSLALKAAIPTGAAEIVLLLASALVPSGHLAFRSQRTVATFMLSLLAFSLYYAAVAVKRFSGIRLFFSNSAVWHSVEDYSRFLYSMIFLCLGIFSFCAMTVPGDAGVVMRVCAIVALMGLYALMCLRAMTGRTFILGPKTEDRIKDIIKGNLRTSYIDKAEEDRKMNNLYRKVMLIMGEKKPYLDPAFRMSDLAEMVYTNKLYLSRTVNLLSGRNFRQFINYHRVQYAIALFKKDPKLKVGEVAEMSGFNSSVSFNMAFKVNTGMTPSEWLQEHSIDFKERL